MDDMYEVPSTPCSRYLVTSLPSSPCPPSSCLPHVTFQPACTAWHTWSSEQAPQDSPRGTLSSLKRPLALAGAFWEASGRGHLSGQRRDALFASRTCAGQFRTVHLALGILRRLILADAGLCRRGLACSQGSPSNLRTTSTGCERRQPCPLCPSDGCPAGLRSVIQRTASCAVAGEPGSAVR